MNLGQTVLEIYDCLTLLRTTTTTPADGAYDNRAKRRLVAFGLKKAPSVVVAAPDSQSGKLGSTSGASDGQPSRSWPPFGAAKVNR